MTDTEPPARPDPDWRRRERPTLVAIGVLVALVIALATILLVRVSVDDRPLARVGDVLSGTQLDGDLEDRAEVLVPWARLEVAIGEPVAELPARDEDRVALLRAPEDGSFVRVEVDTAEDYQIPLAALAAPFEGQAEVMLTADGRTYPVAGLDVDADTDLTEFGGAVWVAVSGEPSDLSLSITVADHTQVVRAGEVEPGRATELDAMPSAEELREVKAQRCGPPVESDTDGLTLSGLRFVECQRQLALRTPYVDGLGWAEDGREFLVVQVVARREYLKLISGTGDATRLWRVREPSFTVTLDGDASVGTAEVNALSSGPFAIPDSDNPIQYVFDVPIDVPSEEVELTLRLAAVPDDPFSSDRRDVLLRWTVPSGESA